MTGPAAPTAVPARLAGPTVALVRGEGSSPSRGSWQVRAGDDVVGGCTWRAEEDGLVVLDGQITEQRRGGGLGTEAAAVLTAWVEQQPGVRLLAARVPPEAAAGLRLLARLGFVEHGSHPPALRLVRPAPGCPRPRGRHVC